MPAAARPMWNRGGGGQRLRNELGDYIRDLRNNRNLTQAQLAELVGYPYLAAVSHIENGRGTIPPERYLVFAQALGVSPRKFMKEVLARTNPWAHAMLFEENPGKIFEALDGQVQGRATGSAA